MRKHIMQGADMKKLFIVFCAFIVFTGAIPLPLGRAAPTDVEDLKWMIVSKVKGYNQSLDNRYQGQYGLLYNLYYLTLSTRWTELMVKGNSLQFSDAEKKLYQEEVISNYSNFNKKFSTKLEPEEDGTVAYKELKLSVGTGGEAGFKKAANTYLSVTVPNYLEKLLQELKSSYDAADTDATLFMEENKDNLRYIYRILTVIAQEQEEMQAIVGNGLNSIDNDPTVNLTSGGKATQLLQDAGYAELLQKGKELSEEESVTVGNVDYSNEGSYIERLAWVKPNSGAQGADYGVDLWTQEEGHGDADKQFKLRDVYVAMIAATSVYKPFSSHVGDKEYLEALAYLTSADATKSKQITQLFSELKDYRKPLYVIEDAGWWDSTFGDANTEETSFPSYSGSGKRLTVEDFIKRIKEEDVSGFVTVRGDFKQVGNDINSWGFYQENSTDWSTFSKNSGGTNTVDTSTPAEDSADNADNGESDDADSGGDTGTATAPTDNKFTQPENVNTNPPNSTVTMASETVNTTKWTSSLFESGYYDGYPITGLAVAKNFLLYHREAENIENANSRSVFINAFGDIVTDDNLVLIPAAANPMLYDKTVGYNPYTVAFMNGYPTVYTAGNKLTLGSADDVGKFILFSESEDIGSKRVFTEIVGDDNVAITHAKTPINIFRDFVDVGQGKSPMLARTESGVPGWWKKRISMFTFYTDKMRALTINSALLNKTVPVFPYDMNHDTDRDIRNLIAYNMYWSYINSADSTSANFNGRLREDFIFRNILVEGLGGSIYASAYNKNMIESYQAMTDDNYNSFKRDIVKFVREVLASLGKVDGVLGVKNQYQDPILGKFMVGVNDYFWYILILLIVVFMVKFLMSRSNLSYTLVVSGIAGAVLYVFLQIAPVYLPMGYNLIVNNISSQLSYKILATKAEKYDSTYKNQGKLDTNGKFKISTTSLDLYKMSPKMMDNIAERYQLSLRDLRSGKVTVVDSTNGVYIEGDTLKVNIDSLLATSPITGSYVEGTGSTKYVYTAEKVNSSVIDYYMPYYMIADGFTETLNKMLEVYNIPKHSTKYKGGIEKDSFIVYSYINSLPFLSPADFEQYSDQADPKEIEKLKSVFTNPQDFLNLDAMLSKPTPEMQESLWYKTFQQNGYLENTEDGKKKYWNFIADTNRKVKKFIIDIKPQVGMISDENLIKMISIYATTVFTTQASDYANWIYPMSLNYQEYTLSDVMLGALIDDYSRFISEDMDVVSYLSKETDIFTTLLFALDIVLAYLIATVIGFLVPVLYILVGILLLYRFITGPDKLTVIKGYLKISTIIFACLTVFVLTFGLASGLNLYFVIYGSLVIHAVIAFVLTMVVSSIITNFADFGNSSINAKVRALTGRNKKDKADKLEVNTTSLNHNDKQNTVIIDTGSRYDLDSSLSEANPDVIDLAEVKRAMGGRRATVRNETYTNVSKDGADNNGPASLLEEDKKRYKL